MLPQHPPGFESWVRYVFLNRKGIRSGWRILVWFLISIVCLVTELIAVSPLIRLLISRSGSTTASAVNLAVAWLAFIPIYGSAVFVATVMERRPIASLGFACHGRSIRELITGLAWGFGLLTVVMIGLVLSGAYQIGGFAEGLVPAIGWGLFMAAGFLGVGAFEDFLFRGYALQNLVDGLGLPAGATISCLLFALLHLTNKGENILGITEVLLGGVLLLVITIRTRSLWMSVGLHAAWDWAQNFVYGVADSGTVLPGGLLHTSHHGPNWLSGGSAGPEGSILALVVNTAAIVYFARASWLTPSPVSEDLWRRFVSPREMPVVPQPSFDIRVPHTTAAPIPSDYSPGIAPVTPIGQPYGPPPLSGARVESAPEENTELRQPLVPPLPQDFGT